MLLPLLAAADLGTTTSTFTATQTATVTLKRLHTVTSTYAVNSTTMYMPTGASSSSSTSAAITSSVTSYTPSATPSPISKSGASTLSSAHIAIAGLAGMAAVYLL